MQTCKYCKATVMFKQEYFHKKTFNKAISINVTCKEYICKCWFKTDPFQNPSPTDLSKTPCGISLGDLIPLFLSCSALKKLEQKDPTAVYFSYIF